MKFKIGNIYSYAYSTNIDNEIGKFKVTNHLSNEYFLAKLEGGYGDSEYLFTADGKPIGYSGCQSEYSPGWVLKPKEELYGRRVYMSGSTDGYPVTITREYQLDDIHSFILMDRNTNKVSRIIDTNTAKSMID